MWELIYVLLCNHVWTGLSCMEFVFIFSVHWVNYLYALLHAGQEHSTSAWSRKKASGWGTQSWRICAYVTLRQELLQCTTSSNIFCTSAVCLPSQRLHIVLAGASLKWFPWKWDALNWQNDIKPICHFANLSRATSCELIYGHKFFSGQYFCGNSAPLLVTNSISVIFLYIYFFWCYQTASDWSTVFVHKKMCNDVTNEIWLWRKKISNRMTASILKQDLNTKRFKSTLIYFNMDTQYAHFWGNSLYQATKWQINGQKWWKMKEKDLVNMAVKINKLVQAVHRMWTLMKSLG